MVKFSIPIHIPINFVPKGKRTVETVYDQGQAEVELREIDPGQTELVGRLGNVAAPHDFYADSIMRRTAITPGQPMRELRWFEGEHWLSVGPLAEFQGMLSAGSDGARSSFENLGHWVTSAVNGPKFDEQAFLRKVGPLRIYENKGDNVRERVAQRSEKLIVLKGELFERVREPYLKTYKRYDNTMHVRIAGFSFDRYEEDRWEGVALPAARDRLDQADRLSDQIRRATGQEPAIDYQLELLRPDLLFRCPQHSSALRGADFVLSVMMQKIRLLNQPAAEAMLGLRDALRASPWHMDHAVLTALEKLADIEDPDPDWLQLVTSMAEFKRKRDASHHSKSTEDQIIVELPQLFDLVRRTSREAIDAYWMDGSQYRWDDTLQVPSVQHDAKRHTVVASTRERVRDAALAAGLDPVALYDQVAAGATVLALQSNESTAVNAGGDILAVGIIDRTGTLEVRARENAALEDYAEARDLLVDALNRRTPHIGMGVEP